MQSEVSKRRGRPPSGGREAILEATLELLRERGIANLTTREVAARAGVSDASIYYHYVDRAGLLRAVFEYGMTQLAYFEEVDSSTLDRREYLAGAVAALIAFFTDKLTVLVAAQSDPELAAALAEHVERKDLGPHRGVKTLGDYLRAEQQAGRVRADADADAVAFMLIEACLGLVATERWMGLSDRLPSIERVLDAINQLLD